MRISWKRVLLISNTLSSLHPIHRILEIFANHTNIILFFSFCFYFFPLMFANNNRILLKGLSLTKGISPLKWCFACLSPVLPLLGKLLVSAGCMAGPVLGRRWGCSDEQNQGFFSACCFFKKEKSKWGEYVHVTFVELVGFDVFNKV